MTHFLFLCSIDCPLFVGICWSCFSLFTHHYVTLIAICLPVVFMLALSSRCRDSSQNTTNKTTSLVLSLFFINDIAYLFVPLDLRYKTSSPHRTSSRASKTKSQRSMYRSNNVYSQVASWLVRRFKEDDDDMQKQRINRQNRIVTDPVTSTYPCNNKSRALRIRAVMCRHRFSLAVPTTTIAAAAASTTVIRRYEYLVETAPMLAVVRHSQAILLPVLASS